MENRIDSIERNTIDHYYDHNYTITHLHTQSSTTSLSVRLSVRLRQLHKTPESYFIFQPTRIIEKFVDDRICCVLMPFGFSLFTEKSDNSVHPFSTPIPCRPFAFIRVSCGIILLTMNDRDRNYDIANSTLNLPLESITEVPTVVIQTSYTDRDGLSQEEFVGAEMIHDDTSYHVGNEGSCIHFESNHQLQNPLLHAQVRSKDDFDNATMIHVDNSYDVSTGSSGSHGEGNHQTLIGVQPSYLQQAALSPLDTVGLPSASVAGKKRKSETGLANVSMKTVMRWRGKEGIDIDCLLGATAASTVEERTRAEDILNATGQLLCILCAQSVSGNKKSVRRHQLKNAKHLVRLNEVANGQPFPSTEAAMTIVVPLPYVPLDLAVSTASRGCQEAWEIVKNAEKANDFPGLTANLESLGGFTAAARL